MGVGNNGNLIPLSERSKEDAFEIRSRGGKACATAQRRRKRLRETLEELLAKGNTQEDICKMLISGEFPAKTFEVIRDTVGEKPPTDVTGTLDITQALVRFVDDGSDSGDTQ